jgi:predicted ATPase
MLDAQFSAYKQWVDLETRGEAICRTHARLARTAGQRAKWTLLAELERATKEALVRDLQANGIAVGESAEKRLEGEVFAEQAASVPWLEAMAMMRSRILFYLDGLRAMTSAVPATQRALASRLLEHEEAWLAFVDRELAGESETSIEPVRAHLEKWRGRDAE